MYTYAVLKKFFGRFSSKPCKIPIVSQVQVMNSTITSDVSHKPLVAVTQVTSTHDKEANFKFCQDLVKLASGKGCCMVFLPEAFDFICSSKGETISNAEPIVGPLISKYKGLAKEFNIWISLGGFHEKLSERNKLSNSHILLNSKGEIVSVYRKLHLFDVELQRIKLRESDYVEGGKMLVSPVDTPAGKLGQLVCYDLRFPECSLFLSQMGADIITYPSSFTKPTGEAHWEILLRARAIENQCYVIAPAQVGEHNESRSSYGHAMIVDPWGEVIAECQDGESFKLAAIDLSYLSDVRKKMPVAFHKRYDVYQPITLQPQYFLPQNEDILQFGQVQVEGKFVFLMSQYSFAFVNLRCILPGHVLVASKRVIPRVEHMLEIEIKDMILMVQKVEKLIEEVYEASSSNIAIQDGKAAGQSIEHVHVHIIPRKEGDFPQTDDIYRHLQIHDKIKSKERTAQEMLAESNLLRSKLQSIYT